jgi:hypothetical protein
MLQKKRTRMPKAIRNAKICFEMIVSRYIPKCNKNLEKQCSGKFRKTPRTDYPQRGENQENFKFQHASGSPHKNPYTEKEPGYSVPVPSLSAAL